MKINWDKKYTTIAVYALIVISLSIVFNNVISKLDVFTGKLNQILVVFQPFIIGCVIAYLLNFILKFYEEKVFKIKMIKKIRNFPSRGLGILFSYVTALIIVYLFMQFVLPQLIESISGLINDIPRYVRELTSLIETELYERNIDQEYMAIINEKFVEITNWVIQLLTNILPLIGNMVMSVASSIWNIILGVISLPV